jgi:Predicted metal-dependent RNase, consists of a metallo-beta-lactamase domain and an RNA-binding KH domain
VRLLSFKQSGIRLKIISSIYQNFPKESRIVRIDFEGPKIAVYVENPDVVNQEIVKKVAKNKKDRAEASEVRDSRAARYQHSTASQM